MEWLRLGLLMLGAAGISAVATLALANFATRLGIVDEPGGRKAHAGTTPVVGGLGVFIALLGMSWASGTASTAGHLLLALSIIIAIGLWDDLREVSPRLKFLTQVVAAGIMIWGAGIELRSIGDLVGWRSIGLSVLAVPLTIFAIVGVVNSINMMDGMDGLAGCISLVAMAWYALVAAQTGLASQALIALLLCSSIAGFLAFNLRFPWQPRARVFLGDAGSLMLGFSLGWFAIDLSQGPGRTFPPIAALWVLMVPLVDCVSLMIRRIRSGRNPFSGDRGHIHHYLLARGFTPSQSLAILVGASIVLGAVGYFSWLFKVREAVLFYPFFFGFFAYHAWIQREWEKIEKRDAGYAAETRENNDSPTQPA